MAGILYVKVDATYYMDDKIAQVGEAPELLYVRALGFAKTMLSDGFVADSQLSFLGLANAAERADALVQVGLWKRDDDREGYWIAAWLKHNPTADEVRQVIEQRREAGRKGGKASGLRRSKQSASSKQEAPASSKTKQVVEANAKQTRSTLLKQTRSTLRTTEQRREEKSRDIAGSESVRASKQERGSGGEPRPTEPDPITRALLACGFSGNGLLRVRSLVTTAGQVEACWTEAQVRAGNGNPRGLLIRMLRDGDHAGEFSDEEQAERLRQPGRYGHHVET